MEQNMNLGMPEPAGTLSGQPGTGACSGDIRQETGEARREASKPRIYPLTPMERGMYLEQKMDCSSASYNLNLITTIRGRSLETVKQTLLDIFAAHEAFHSAYGERDGLPVRILTGELPKIEERTARTREEVVSAAEAYAVPFDLEAGVPLRPTLYQVADGSVILHLAIHHIAFDGGSLRIFTQELLDGLRGKRIAAKERDLSDLSGRDTKEEREKGLAFFKEVFAGGVPVCEMPIRGKRPQKHPLTDREILLEFGPDKCRDIKSRARQFGLTDFELIFSAISMVLGKYTASEDVVLGIPTNVRPEGAEQVVGMFVNTAPVRVKPVRSLGLSEYFSSVREAVRSTTKGHVLPFEDVVAAFARTRDESRSPVFDVSFNYLWEPAPFEEDGLYLDNYVPLQRMSRDIGLTVRRTKEAIRFMAQYPSELFEEEVIRNFLEQIWETMDSIGRDGVKTVRDALALPKDQAARLESFSRSAEAELPEVLLHRLFEDQAAEHPERTALIACDRSLTFKELDGEANRIANGLLSRGMKRGESAVLLLPRRSYYFSALFGVLKAGMAFIPCDPAYPAERIRHILGDADASCVLTTAEHLGDFKGGEAIDIRELLKGEDASDPKVPMDGEDLAYMIYTSGSTGKPKGVMLRHKGICNYVLPHPANILFDIVKRKVHAWLSVTTVSFDMCLKETVSILCNGKTLVFAGEEEMNDPKALAELFARTGADGFNATPSRLLQYLDYGPFGEAIARCRVVASGGEGYPMALLNRLRTLLPRDAFIVNTYGPTEITVSSNGAVMNEADHIHVGRPLLNYVNYIVDKDGELSPRGVVGELLIGGPGVALGYRNLPEQTAKSFVTYKGIPVYRSGDYARFDAEGNVEILGRMDSQVKLRGLRIELGEIEGLMEQQPGIRRAVAAVRKINGQDNLCAWFTAEGPADISGLRDALKKSLTAYMVPAALMQVEAIPQTANGKTDLKALPDPELSREELAPPQNGVQQRIFDIAAKILGTEAFGIHTDLYSAGLSSLSSVGLSLRLSEAFDVPVQIRDFRENDTVAKLEKLLTSGKEEESFPVLEEYPVTKIQEGIFFEAQSHPGTTMYNIPFLLELDDSIDLSRLRQAVVRAVAAHPYMNTRFFIDGKGQIRQKRAGAAAFAEGDIEVFRAENLENLMAEIVRPFDLLKERLFRAAILRTPEKNYFFLDIHHVICDGTGRVILFRDISRAYAGETLAEEKYGGYEAALLEKNLRESDFYDKAKKYYTDLFEGCEPDCLPIPEAKEAEEGSGSVVAAGKADGAAIAAYCAENRVSPGAFYTAAFGYAAARFASMEDAVFTTVNNGRNDPRFAGSVSMYVKTYPVLCKTAGRSVRDYILEVGRQLTDSLAYDVYSFEEISRELGVRADLLFAWQGDIAGEVDSFCGAPARRIPMELDEAKAAIEFMVYPEGEKTTYHCSFRRSSYTEGFIRGFIRVFDRILGEFLCKKTLAEVELLDEETAGLLERFNDTKAPYVPEDIVAMFRRQAEKTPESLAVVCQDRRYTYRQTDEISERIASYVSAKGIGLEDVVSVLIPRCEYMVLASLGVLKTGALYQPLDPTYPPERLEFMIQDAGAKLLIADRSLMDRLPNYAGEVLYLDEIPALPEGGPVRVRITPENGFIVLYTSGSTGVPKGVVLMHGNLCNFCHWYRHYYEIDDTARVLAYASYGFDAHMMDIYPAIVSGASVYIITEDIRLDFPALQKYFEENRITHSFMTTQVGRQFALYYTGDSLRHLSVGGEALAPVDVTGKKFAFHNAYGPTECTIFTTIFRVDKVYQRVPIGKTFDNIRLYVVDGNGRLLPPGVPGELWVAGHGVGRAYLNRPEKNAEVFIPNPFSGEEGYTRVYRTGDVVRRMADGGIDFIGRNDAQVKIRGFRIELTEVEEIIRQFPGVKDVTVQAFAPPAGGKALAAYVVSDSPVDEKALADFITKTKPPYMVPEAVMQIDKIPLNQNQKVNRRALPKPEVRKEAPAEAAPRPLTRFEEEIAAVVKNVVGEVEISPAEELSSFGLTSIGAIGLATMLAERFQTEIPVNELLGGMSLVDLENRIFEEWMSHGFSPAGEGAGDGESAPMGEKREACPLSFVQQAIYYDAMKRENADTIYNIPFCFAFDEIDADRLAGALKAAVRAHAYLNTHIEIRDGAIVQVRDDLREADIPVLEMEEDSFKAFKDAFTRPFDMGVGPLYRFAVVRVPGKKTYLLMDIHHMVFDGFSTGIFLRDAGRAYQGESLKPEAYSYFDYAQEEAERKGTEAYREDEAYFENLMQRFESPSEIPADRSGMEEKGQQAESRRRVSKELADGLSARLGVTPASLFLAASFYTVSRFSGSREVYISTIDSGRNLPKTHKAVGMFVHTLPLNMSFEKDCTVRELAAASEEALRGSVRHEGYPFAELAAKYGYTTQIMYECQIGILSEEGSLGGVPYENVRMGLETPKFKVSLTILEEDGDYTVDVRYNDAIYQPETMEALAEALGVCVEHMAEDPEQSVRKLSLLSREEAEVIAAFGRAETAELPETVFHRVFEARVRENPEGIALIACDRTLTFGELNSEANRVASSLMDRGLQKGGSAVLLLPRRSFYFSAMYGVLKAGAAFIPCDPEYPPERIRHIVHDAEASFIITTEEHLPDYEGERAVDIRELLLGEDRGNPEVAVTGEDMAYMIYTSGSTGRPKGVMMKHVCVVNCVYPHPVNLHYHVIKNEARAVLGVTTVSFDMSFQETAGSLLNGKTLVFASEEELNDPRALTALFEQTGADVFDATPSRYLQYMEYEPFRKALSHCRLVMVGGEGFPQTLLEKLQAVLSPNAHIENAYGPTETTMACNGADLIHAPRVVAGPPLLNYLSYIVDLDGNPVPRRVIGELLIGGIGVGIGYRNLQEMTEKRFITYNGGRVYRSGDYARWDMDGNVEVLGRMDNQVKLRGQRIELGEIEGLMEAQPDIRRAVVAIRKVRGQDNLCAWFTADREIDLYGLREELKKKLTAYMVPVAFAQVEKMPQTPNGKTDMKALPEPKALELGEYTAPANSVEKFFCELFQDILGVERVGALDDFFAFGGTSLTATTVMIDASEAGYALTYGDVFKYKTPRELAARFVGAEEKEEENAAPTAETFDNYDYGAINELLSKNTIASFNGGEQRPLGNILLTGATGYMGIHVLTEYLRSETGKAYCLVRRGRYPSAKERLKNLLAYYFEREFMDADDRLEVFDGDVTDYACFEALRELPIDTIFNCAANVKHFSSGTDIEDVNVGGARNCLRFAEEKGIRLIHFSTTSVGGAMLVSDPSQLQDLDEQSLYFGQLVDNQYISSKLLAERYVLEAAAERGADVKVIRVGALSARDSDGEFQINVFSNSAMGRLRSHALLGCFPYSMIDRPFRMGPIDTSARSFLFLARTPKECCVFHAINNHIIPFIDIIRCMNELGLGIEVVEEPVFLRAMREAEADPEKAAILSSILAYTGMYKDAAIPVQERCEYTSQVLARFGFYWNPTDGGYIRRFIEQLIGLGFFDEDNLYR